MNEPNPKPPAGEVPKQPPSLGLLVSAATDFAVSIAVPLLVFIYLGRWLDRKFDTKLFVVAGILLALALSSYAIYKHIKKLSKLK